MKGQPALDNVGPETVGTTSLMDIAIKARSHPKHRFQNLYRMLNLPNLLQAWHRLNKNASAGVDRVVAQVYGKDLYVNLVDLEQRLKTKRYRCKGIRRTYIPKSNGKQRPLGIPALEDKIVQQAVADILGAVFEADFLECSFAYRPGRGAGDAVASLSANLQWGPFGYVVESDIKGFFDEVDHDWLLEMLRQRIDDKALLSLIHQWLTAKVHLPDGQVIKPLSGTPQGGVISPVLANIYLHFVLDLWFERRFKTRLTGRAIILRYADDFVAAFQYRQDAEAFFGELPDRLSKFNLKVAEEKTSMVRFSRFHPSMRRRIQFLGFEYYWWRGLDGSPRLLRRTARSKLKMLRHTLKEWIKLSRSKRLHQLATELRVKMLGHYRYFAVKGNGHSLHRYYTMVIELLFKWLNRRSQRRSYNWVGFKQLLDCMRLPAPSSVQPKRYRIFWLFEKGAAHAR
ncbi:MAG: group II intron reverse transcriptase/maturase [Gammaproteobacteria bacterium]|nr:group II intron reverse transcriptase/maturase [Gammaproteobacteria bacterium]